MPMPIGIDAYKKMMTADIGQLAILNPKGGETGVGAASGTGLNILQRLFNTGASKKVNIEVANDFKRSMVAAYGQKIAEEALDSTIGSKCFSGAKLSSEMVKRAIDQAERYVAGRLNLTRTTDAQGNAQVSLCVEGTRYDVHTTGLGDTETKALATMQSLIARLDDLLMEMPTDAASFQSFSERVSGKDGIWNAASALMSTPLSFKGHPEAQKTFDAQCDALGKRLTLINDKVDEATEVCTGNPVTYKSIADFAGKYIDSAISALDGLKLDDLQKYGLNFSVKAALPGARHALAGDGGGILRKLAELAANPSATQLPGVDEKTFALMRTVIPEVPAGTSPDDACPDPVKFIGKNFEEKLAAFCAAVVRQELADTVEDPKAAEGFEAGTFQRELASATLKELGKALNNGPWGKIDKFVTFSLGGLAHSAKSEITPASQMGGAVGALYKDGEPKGCSFRSYDEAKHAVNLAQSEFKVDDKTVFSGIRHGVHAAVGITNGEDFRKANVSRARETLVAAFTSRPDLVEAAIKDPGKPVRFPFSSVSLLSPDASRGRGAGRSGDEKLMLRAQTEAYKALDGQTIDVDIPCTTIDEATGQVTTEMKRVKIQPQVTQFNYGVNWGGAGASGGGGPSGDVNGPGLAKLDELASARLGELDSEFTHASGDDQRAAILKKQNAISSLRSQIAQADKAKSYRNDGNEACRMAARIAVLTYLCGGVPAWSSRNGTDRAGRLDVECKFLATLVELGRRIPEPGAQLTAEEGMLFRNILLQGGNLEMQKYNTVIGGYGGAQS